MKLFNIRIRSCLLINAKVFCLISLNILCCNFLTIGQGVRLINNAKTGCIEIRNAFCGVVLPGNELQRAYKYELAPVQSLILSNGAYSDTSLNFLKASVKPDHSKLEVITNSGNVVQVRISYFFRKPPYRYGDFNFKGSEAGKGFYTCLITLHKDQKYLTLLEDTDFDISYGFRINHNIVLDKARYRGWESTSETDGYEIKGVKYRNEVSRGYPMDATVDLEYIKRRQFPRLALWEPSGGEVNTGRYWQMFQNMGGDNSSLIGFFQGKPSFLIGAHHNGPSLLIQPANESNNEKNIAEILIDVQRRAPDNRWFPHKRFQWGIFISTKRELLPPSEIQTVGRVMNQLGGLSSKVVKYASLPVKLTSSFYKAAIFQSADLMNGMISRVKTDVSFYNKLIVVDAGYKTIWDAWRFPDSAKSLLNQMLRLNDELIQNYTVGNGSYFEKYRYWKGGLNFKYYALAISALFADSSIEISKSDKRTLEQMVGLMGRIFWDDDNVPFFDSAGVNLGPANMQYQYRNNARNFFALILAPSDDFKARAKEVKVEVERDINKTIYANGSSFGTPHYTQATIDPIIFTALQLREAGVADLFIGNHRLLKFVAFYKSLLTPPSVRFGANRKLISLGDGSEESAALFGLLSTAFKNSNPLISSELYRAFINGPIRFSFAGPIPFACDLMGNVSPYFTTGTANFSGYMSTFRSQLGAKSESAAWVLNGDSLFDHRNDDAGEFAIYALGAPLSLSRSSFYYPSASDARIRSVVIPESLFPEWKSAEQPIGDRSLTNRTWPASSNTGFVNFGDLSSTTVLMSGKGNVSWNRQFTSFSFGKELPVYLIFDTLVGTQQAIWSLPTMTEGPIQTMAGVVNSPLKIYDHNGIKQLPSASPVMEGQVGWTPFLFTGQKWKLHPSGGINCYVYSFNRIKPQFTISNWATTWQNSEEATEFFKTNGTKYQEAQHYLRLRGSNAFLNILLPFLKGTEPYLKTIQPDMSGKLIFQSADRRYVIENGFYQESGSTYRKYIVWREGMELNNADVALKGGPVWIEWENGLLRVRVHGNSGKRKIRLPLRGIAIKEKQSSVVVKENGDGSVLIFDYQSNGLDLLPGEKGYKEYVFNYKN